MRRKSDVGGRESEVEGPAGRQRVRTLLLASLLLVPSLAFSQDGEDGTWSDYAIPDDVRSASKSVLERPEFRNVPRLDLGPGGKKAEPIKSKEEERKAREVEAPRPAGGSGLLADLFGGAVSMMVVLVLVVVLGAIVALVVLGLKRWERAEKGTEKPDGDAAADDEPEPLVTPGERPADAWLAAARSAAAAGRFDEALSLLLLGAMGQAERAGLIRPRRGLTYRDYLRAVPDSSAWHGTLDRLIRAYAPIGFGRREATAAAFDAAVGPYEAALAAEPLIPPLPGERGRG